ncbi:hypothetical protein KZX37_02345 [Microbacterium sp. EYE_5]|uniref:hypothetical protein n=1 Tax=unclassified Microbacterium TaxID=2609290 RepID=UPI002003D721|nr:MULTISPECIES: hypothetical protein [unclassified Microbacterium]MCK6079458.1 hypothetical protein [Microbacterium sp. EYE_382]MCK6084728.1 hypothetical protein [Microbacterium sp. EYE_384]MCK6123045.1 hypothetical protein [Microbacterium sp. EYE_80]MCK6125492.1 hypothetical protein [Microbacterium sp. EYE_79]MCK6140412.1 hypothetical protein [Microbacterium sp. EYE_39]
MSSDDRRARRRKRQARGFSLRLVAVVAVLAVIAAVAAIVTTLQGPRVTSVESDPSAAVTSAGARVIFETTQSLQEVDASQVTVTPAASFTVDTSGRSVGIRFTDPLWDETTYAVRIDGVTGVGGGPASVIDEEFTTPRLHGYVLQRGEDDDTVFRVDLAGDAEPVFTHPHIEDFRATAGHLVISTLEDDVSHLVVTRTDGSAPRELALPGEGLVTNLQSAERGNTIGYTFTDADISADGGRESLLFTGSTADPHADPVEVARTGGDARVEDWWFVPGTDSILMLTFDGALSLIAADGSDPVELGNATGIDDIAGTTAFIERVDGPAVVDLTTGEESALPPTDEALGQTGEILALADGSTLRALTPLDGLTPLSTTLTQVDADGRATPIAEIAPTDGLLQTCVSPSGRYAAVTVAPDVVSNTYDGYLLPLPEQIETRIYTLDGSEVVAIRGFDLSWCRRGPSL